MQYWLYAFKLGKGNVLIGKYETYEEAHLERDRLDANEYEYADIIEMEWGKEPRFVSGLSFEYRKSEAKVKRKRR